MQVGPDLLLCESGGDNLAANFSSELADYTVYVIGAPPAFATPAHLPRPGALRPARTDALQMWREATRCRARAGLASRSQMSW